MAHKNEPSRSLTTVALINASDDTVEMVQRMLDTIGIRCLVSCRFADLRKGSVIFSDYLLKHDPAVVIFDISPPYAANWDFFKIMRDAKEMENRGLVLTTTNKLRLEEFIGSESFAIEIVGKPYDLRQIANAIAEVLPS